MPTKTITRHQLAEGAVSAVRLFGEGRMTRVDAVLAVQDRQSRLRELESDADREQVAVILNGAAGALAAAPDVLPPDPRDADTRRFGMALDVLDRKLDALPA